MREKKQGRAGQSWLRVPYVRPLNSCVRLGLDLAKRALTSIEQSPQGRLGVKAAEATPIEAAVFGYQGSAVTITDQGIVVDRAKPRAFRASAVYASGRLIH